MSRKLRPFGGTNTFQLYDIPTITGWLERLIMAEEERDDVAPHLKTPRGKRLSKAYDALQLLTEICEQES